MYSPSAPAENTRKRVWQYIEKERKKDPERDMTYPRRTSFSDPKDYFGKIIKLLGNNLFLCIAHFRTVFGQYV